MDIMQKFDKDILCKNKDVLQRIKYNNPLNQEAVDMYSNAKNALYKGYPVYAIIEQDGVSHSVQLIDCERWDADSVTVKLNNGTEFQVPINAVKIVKC